jgi:hypothetical protein
MVATPELSCRVRGAPDGAEAVPLRMGRKERRGRLRRIAPMLSSTHAACDDVGRLVRWVQRAPSGSTAEDALSS